MSHLLSVLLFLGAFSLAVVAIVAAILLIRTVINEKYSTFVEAYSVALKQLGELNSKQNFFHIKDCIVSYSYDNEKLYDNVSCKDFLTYQLQFIQKVVMNEIYSARKNVQMYAEYDRLVKQIVSFGEYSEPIGKLKKEKLDRLEKKLFYKQIIPPIKRFVINVTLYRTDLNGNIFDHKRAVFYPPEIEQIIGQLNKQVNGFYTDRTIWDTLCRVERGFVSNKVRFDIYKRDGYRCRRCGIRDDGANLEIDHIKPIAKGGKSTYDNLQTLCKRCNREKGDSYRW